MTVCLRVVSICLMAFMVSGCYTQVRSPLEREKIDLSRSENDMQGTVPLTTQRFEYYQNYDRVKICSPYDFNRVSYYDSFDDGMYWLYNSRPPYWYTPRLVWQQACWVTVYDRTWCGFPPTILAPQIVYHSPIYVRDREPVVIAQTAPPHRPTSVVVEGVPPSKPPTRPTPISTRPPPKQPQSSGTSGKQASEKTEEKTKEEKREDKRGKKKKRGGMR